MPGGNSIHAILISGITGFAGSNIAHRLLSSGYYVIGLKRRQSDCWRCADILDNITWTDIEDDYATFLQNYKITAIIHCAWDGAGVSSRQDAGLQQKNLELLKGLLQVAVQINVSKFIALGSQAEYGILNAPVSEISELSPVTEYGRAKVAGCDLVRQVCDKQGINWYWLRLFSLYGPWESENWLIPYVVTSLIKKKSAIQLTDCTQEYAYLYIDDLSEYILLLIEHDQPLSGVYNISGSEAITLKNVITQIKKYFPGSVTELQFGALPSRTGQSGVLKGEMAKFHLHIGVIKEKGLEKGLKATVKYYKSKIK